MKNIILSFVFFASSLLSLSSIAQQDTVQVNQSPFSKTYPQYIIPAALVTYGIIALESDALKTFDHRIRDRIQQPDLAFKTKLDNFLLFSPAVAVYALNAFGVKGENDLINSSKIYLTSMAIMGGTVYIIKKSAKTLRPDESTYNSFPSGHTAAAFAAAEFMHQEFKHTQPLLSYAGYLPAAATGGLRMFNDRHYLSDVIAGAGIGILSTKAAYWINKKLFTKKEPKINYPK